MPLRILICTDLDRTLLPNGNQPESAGARTTFASFVLRPEVTLAYVSGRDRRLVEDAIKEYQLPVPDWVIGDVGTTIYNLRLDDWHHWDEWEQAIATDWQGLKAQDLQPLFADLPDLRLQETSKQNLFKLSYYLPIQSDIQSLLHEMKQRLIALNLTASLVHSIDEMSGIGLLDVLPARATKLHAIEFLMQHQEFDIKNTVFAGDSGNDLAVFGSTVQSVLVANANADIIEQAQTLALQQGNRPGLYLAQGDFLGMNGNYSAGILEGIAHFLPETQSWMKK
jgi:sucrose-6-phosphatase